MFTLRAKIVICVFLTLAVGLCPGEETSVPGRKEHRIPFQNRNGLIYMAAVVNENHVTLILDTGAGTTAFDTKIAPPIHADKMTRLDLAKGSMLAFHVPVEFTLGDPGRKDSACTFRREVAVGNFTFDGAEGVIGVDVLRSFKAVTVDFRDSVVVLVNP